MKKQFILSIAIAGCMAALMLFAQRAYTQTEAAKPSTDERLATIEAKLDKLATAVGSISGRNSLSDYIEREFTESQRQMSDIQNDLRRVRDDVKRLQSRR